MIVRVLITRPASPDCGKIISVDLEEYLRDVLPSEIYAGSCHLQAQCAQAIAARSYAVCEVLAHKNKPYDVDDTSAHREVRNWTHF